jgi:hypothetical protein
MLEVRGDRLFGVEGSYNLAGAAFNIEGLGSARLLAKKTSLSYFFPVPKPKEAAQAEQPLPELAIDSPKRHSGGAAYLLQGLSPMSDDEEITRKAQGIIEVENRMMICSDNGCMMMVLVEEILLTEL